jgi:hypothetical protein
LALAIFLSFNVSLAVAQSTSFPALHVPARDIPVTHTVSRAIVTPPQAARGEPKQGGAGEGCSHEQRGAGLRRAHTPLLPSSYLLSRQWPVSGRERRSSRELPREHGAQSVELIAVLEMRGETLDSPTRKPLGPVGCSALSMPRSS